MKLFLGWSGPVSRDCAACLQEWLPLVVPGAVPWFSEEDIAKGGTWRDELDAALEEAGWGIFLLVSDHLDSSWLSFEAGRLAKKRVSPLLLDPAKSREVPDPLRAFQITRFERRDMRRLVRDLETATPTKDRAISWDRAFEFCWPGLEAEIQRILKGESTAFVPQVLPASGSLEHSILALLTASSGRSASEVASELEIGEGEATESLRLLAGAGLLESRLIDPFKKDLRFWPTSAGRRLAQERTRDSS